MTKNNSPIGERIAAAKSLDAMTSFNGVPACLGETGVIEGFDKYSAFKGFIVLLDSGKKTKLFKDELYFPNDTRGYNQPCFR